MKDKPYAKILGKVMYIQVGTRFDISNVVRNLSQLQKNPGSQHWRALIHLLGYLKATAHYQLIYRPPPEGISAEEWVKPIGFVDADYAGCKDMRRSTLGYVFTMSGTLVSWSSKHQGTMALSTTEAEYISLAQAAQQARWMYLWCTEIGFPQQEPALLKGDNTGSIHLSKNTKDHHKVKHINVRHHFLCQMVSEEKIKINHILGNNNPADISTKPLAGPPFRAYLEALGLNTT